MRQCVGYGNFSTYEVPVCSDVHEAFQAEIEAETEAFRPETEARPRRWSTCSRRGRDIHIRDRDETEAVDVRGEAETRR